MSGGNFGTGRGSFWPLNGAGVPTTDNDYFMELKSVSVCGSRVSV